MAGPLVMELAARNRAAVLPVDSEHSAIFQALQCGRRNEVARVVLTASGGLPNRPWFQHMIYAPGFYTGYGVKTLPAVRESIEQKQWSLASEQIVRVGKVLENTGEAIEGASAELARAVR